MTEQEWLDSDDPSNLLWFLRSRGNDSERKSRLCNLAVIRRIPRKVPDPNHEQALQAWERQADGEMSTVDVQRLFPGRLTGDSDGVPISTAVSLIHEVYGNPFRPVTIDPAWLTPTVVSLAQGIYDERAFDRLPILADALEDAGCTNADILNHCRQPGEHVLGCWCVDSVLGKQ